MCWESWHCWSAVVPCIVLRYSTMECFLTFTEVLSVAPGKSVAVTRSLAGLSVRNETCFDPPQRTAWGRG